MSERIGCSDKRVRELERIAMTPGNMIGDRERYVAALELLQLSGRREIELLKEMRDIRLGYGDVSAKQISMCQLMNEFVSEYVGLLEENSYLHEQLANKGGM